MVKVEDVNNIPSCNVNFFLGNISPDFFIYKDEKYIANSISTLIIPPFFGLFKHLLKFLGTQF
jgi:hypothetical protein